jgi:hypothetical protein
MKQAALAILVLGLLAAGCDGDSGGTTTTTSAPAWALDPAAPAGNLAQPEGGYNDVVIDGETWQGRHWLATAGGPIDVSYLGGDECVGWASRAPVVEYTLPTDGEPWRISFDPYVPVAPIGTGGDLVGDVPQGLVVVVRGPDGAWACSGEYQGYELSPSIVVEFSSAPAGAYDVWLAAPEGASADGEVVILTPEASWPTTTATTSDETEATPASTFPPTTG